MPPSSRWTLPKHSTPSSTSRSHVNSTSSIFRMLSVYNFIICFLEDRSHVTHYADGHLKLLTSMPASCRVPVLVHHPSTSWLPTYTPPPDRLHRQVCG